MCRYLSCGMLCYCICTGCSETGCDGKGEDGRLVGRSYNRWQSSCSGECRGRKIGVEGFDEVEGKWIDDVGAVLVNRRDVD